MYTCALAAPNCLFHIVEFNWVVNLKLPAVCGTSILDNDDAGDGGFEDVSDALVLLPMLASGNLNLFKKSLAAKVL